VPVAGFHKSSSVGEFVGLAPLRIVPLPPPHMEKGFQHPVVQCPVRGGGSKSSMTMDPSRGTIISSTSRRSVILGTLMLAFVVCVVAVEGEGSSGLRVDGLVVDHSTSSTPHHFRRNLQRSTT
jgi:hypothetical protein